MHFTCNLFRVIPSDTTGPRSLNRGGVSKSSLRPLMMQRYYNKDSVSVNTTEKDQLAIYNYKPLNVLPVEKSYKKKVVILLKIKNYELWIDVESIILSFFT